MKRIVLFLLVLIQTVLCAEATAAPCGSASIATYTALGSSGCTVGNVSFSDFAVLPPAAGAIASSAIVVTPVVVGATVVGLTFAVNPTSSGGLYYDDLVSYRVTGLSTSLTGATVDFAGTAQAGDAAVSVNENLCLAGVFLGADGVSNCSSGNALDLAVIDVGFGPDPAYSLGFLPVGSLAVVTDIAFDSGSGFVPDSASRLTSATNLFTVSAAPAVVPEPPAVALLAVGAIGLAWSRRRSGAAAT